MAKVLEQLTADELATRERELLSSLQIGSDISGLAPTGLEIREQELIESLKKDGIEIRPDIPPPIYDETPSGIIQRDEGVLKLAEMPELAIADPKDISVNYLRLKEDIKAKFGTAEPIGFI